MAELNGAPATPAQLRALALVNYGHFTTMRVAAGRVRGLSHHVERLVRDCRTLFAADLDPDRIRAYLHQAVAGRDGACIVRITVYDPATDLGRPGAPADPHVLVTTRPADHPAPGPWRVRSTSYTRDLPAVKHLGLFGPIWHRRQAQLDGFDDAVFTGARSHLSEGPTWNIAFYDGERIIWPDAEVLPGITMRLLQQAHDATTVAPVDPADLPRMHAAFATNTAIGVRAITAIDDVEFPAEHPVFDTLRKEYEEIPADPA